VVEGFPDLRNRAGDHNILNCSFGCGISGHLPIYKEWADSTLLAGIHVVAASGSPETSEWPAYLSSVLGVDCALSNDTGLRYVPGRMVEFAAAAAEVRVPWKDRGHRVLTGSSFAAAWLSGCSPDCCLFIRRSIRFWPNRCCAELRRFFICSANHASQAGLPRSSSHSSILCSSASWPDRNASTSLSMSAGGRADWRPCTSPSASSRNRKRISNSAGIYSLRFHAGDL
jgi:hypothetical protein